MVNSKLRIDPEFKALVDPHSAEESEQLRDLEYAANQLGVEAETVRTKKQVADSPPLLIDAKRLAVMLSVSVATVWRMDASGRLPSAVRPSPGVKRWRREEIREWIDVGCPSRKDWEAIKRANK